jgi:ABC-type polysaccharide/polyol phosphate export permease
MQTESILAIPKETSVSSNIDMANLPKKNNKTLAIADFRDGLMKWRIWFLLAYQDIRLRYRRSILGPFWLTLSMAITVYSMGFLYGHLFHIELKDYFPYLVAGMLAWSLISMSLNDLTDTFISYESLLKEIKLPYTLHIQRIAVRNILIFFHNIVVMLPIYLFFSESAHLNLNTLFLIPCLFLVYINAVFFGLLLAMIAARYRDISQLIKNLIQVVFFITPVMWNPSVLPTNKLFVVWGNPIYPFIEMIRAPLLGTLPSFSIVATSLGITLFTVMFSFIVFTRYRSRIIYWL